MGMTEFVKMHGAGNDFVVIDNRDGRFSLEQLIAAAPHWCDRRIGIGADGLLVLQTSDKADYTMIYRNADGSDAGMCGNGGRCIAAFARSLGVPASHTFECKGHVYAASEHGGLIRLQFPTRPIVRQTADGWRIDTGTDHLVVPVEASLLSDREFLVSTGRELRHRHNANVNFVPENPDPSALLIRTYERGVEDLTLACGTGALSVATWWHHAFGKGAEGDVVIPVVSEGGTLQAGFRFTDSAYHSYHLTGPAVRVFEGRIPI
jgi:diaminopimelate epimerase